MNHNAGWALQRSCPAVKMGAASADVSRARLYAGPDPGISGDLLRSGRRPDEPSQRWSKRFGEPLSLAIIPRVSGSGPRSPLGSVPAAQAGITLPPLVSEWIAVPGGRLPAGQHRPAADVKDLEWLIAPVTAGLARRLAGLPAIPSPAWPVICLNWDRATALARLLGDRLPTSAEWEWMAGVGARRYPWGRSEPTPGRCQTFAGGPWGCPRGRLFTPSGGHRTGCWTWRGTYGSGPALRFPAAARSCEAARTTRWPRTHSAASQARSHGKPLTLVRTQHLSPPAERVLSE